MVAPVHEYKHTHRCRWYNTGEGFCVTLRWKHWSTLSIHPHTHLLNQVCLRIWEAACLSIATETKKEKDERKEDTVANMCICIHACVKKHKHNVFFFLSKPHPSFLCAKRHRLLPFYLPEKGKFHHHLLIHVANLYDLTFFSRSLTDNLGMFQLNNIDLERHEVDRLFIFG